MTTSEHFPEFIPHPLGLDPETTTFPRPPALDGLPRAEKTRLSLMAATASEIYEKGYQGTALSDIIERAGVTKGALYHHFPDKHALALVSMDHFFNVDMNEVWVDPIRQTDDPLETLKQIIGFLKSSGVMENGLKHGCPLVNLTEEMGQRDEAFRAMLEHHAVKWRGSFIDAIERGIKAGNVRPDVDPEGLALMIMALRHGVISQAKVAQDMGQMHRCAMTFFKFLDSLRPEGSQPTD